MKIVLADMRDALKPVEREFQQPIVRVGRDSDQCHVVFDRMASPMVSRLHAEFHLMDGHCLLVDTNSSFGTFLDGRRVTGPIEVQAGGHVRFGPNGPVLLIVRIEGITAQTPLESTDVPLPVEIQASHHPSNIVQPSQNAASSFEQIPAQLEPSSGTSAAHFPALEFENRVSGELECLSITTEKMLLGRDSSSGVPIDAEAAVVSRRHAEIRQWENQFVLVDLNSFNGTLLNNQRITEPTPLYDDDRIQLGMGGPILRFRDPANPAPIGASSPARRVMSPVDAQPATSTSLSSDSGAHAPLAALQRTIILGSDNSPLNQQIPVVSDTHPQLLIERFFDEQQPLTVGRGPDNDIRLDGLQISKHHARFSRENGGVTVQDVGSTNGVYVNGVRIVGQRAITNQDVIQIGPFILQANAERGVAVFDWRSKTRIDAINITKPIPSRSDRATTKLLDDVSLTIHPNEFVGVLGPSGAGKSTLMNALNGTSPANSGRVFINGLDLYQHLDSLKQSIGYVPQDDIIHRELTVYRTLYYVARLRLSRDVSNEEIDQIVSEVLDVTDLAERRDVPVAQLSGGQRKRVSIAVELITKPSVIFLDEPTSGLDPATEDRIMKLFRQITESGRTVVLTTHAMENVRLFDKIVVLMRGKLIFYGTPQEALTHFKAKNFKNLYDQLEAPIKDELSKLPLLSPDATREEKRAHEERREQIAEATAEEWRRRFQNTITYQLNIIWSQSWLKPDEQPSPALRRHSTPTHTLRQWATLTRRYIDVLGRNKGNLLTLLGQAPIIAFLTYLVVGARDPRDFPYFVLALVAIWFGTSVAAREIVKERAVYNRERMINLKLLPYVGSKLFVLSLVVTAQCILLFGTLKLLPMSLPGHFGGLLQLLVMILTGMAGIALGLFISAVVKTSEMATSLVPLILIPQILFPGLLSVPTRVARVVGLAMPATWAFDEMKRLSTLDTLLQQGSHQNGPTKGLGLYKHIEESNAAKAKNEIERYQQQATESMEEYERRIKEYLLELRANPHLSPPEVPVLGPAPDFLNLDKISDYDQSGYVSFLHPWGGVVLNAVMLIFMFLIFVSATVATLRTQDAG